MSNSFLRKHENHIQKKVRLARQRKLKIDKRTSPEFAEYREFKSKTKNQPTKKSSAGKIARHEKTANLYQYAREMRSNPTPSEQLFKNLLDDYDIPYQFQHAFPSKSFTCIADFYIKTSQNPIVVEIDGSHHRTDPEQVRKDQYRTAWLKRNKNCHVLRFSNDQVKDDPKACLKRFLCSYLLRCPDLPVRRFLDVILPEEIDVAKAARSRATVVPKRKAPVTVTPRRLRPFDPVKDAWRLVKF